MSMPQVKELPDGERIVVDTFSGWRYPPDEEAVILAQVRQEEARQEPQSADQQH